MKSVGRRETGQFLCEDDVRQGKCYKLVKNWLIRFFQEGHGDEMNVTEKGLVTKGHPGGGLGTEMGPRDVVR